MASRLRIHSHLDLCSIRTLLVAILVLLLCGGQTQAKEHAGANAPVVNKVEPPNWWLNLTPDVMLLLSGKNLQATHAECNLPEVVVSRTQSSAGGNYLFVWLKFLPQLKSGTAVCRVMTAKGQTTFELPISARKQILGRNQGLSLDDVVYLIIPDRFANGDPTNDEPAEFPGSHDRSKPLAYHGGDLRGITSHLPYLKDLGVTTICLTPIVKNSAPADDRGFDVVDLYAVDPHLGTVRNYQELVEAAHKQRMKVFFDVVPNRVSPGHPWVQDPPMADWFLAAAEHHPSSSSLSGSEFYGKPESKESRNRLYEVLADPHTPLQMRNNLADGGSPGILPELNTENPLVAQYLIQNSIWWAEISGLDGYRIETFPYVPRAYWAQWHQELRRIYPRLSTIGEVPHPDPTVTSFFVGGRKEWDGTDTQLTTLLDYPYYFALREVLLNGAALGRITDVLRQDALYPRPDFLVPFLGDPSETRFAGENGASSAKLRLAFGLTLTLRGIPELYYGDEIGMSGGGDLDNRGEFPGGWPEDEHNAFVREGRTREQQAIFEYVQALLRLKREHNALGSGRLWHLACDDSSYVFLRESDEEKLVVAFHKGLNPKTISLSLQGTPAEGAAGISTLFGGAQGDLTGQQLKLALPAQSLSILALQ